MRKAFRVCAIVCAASLAAHAGDAVSAAFTFDARYSASGISAADFAAYEAVGVSGAFLFRGVGRAADLNQNGIPDAWESLYGLSGDNAKAAADPDGDGWTNLEEYNAGTNPMVAEDWMGAVGVSAAHLVDTWIEASGKGMWDLVEVFSLSGAFEADTVGRAADSDKDGLPDWWEELYGLDAFVNDAAADLDGDGRSNLEEYNAGTNPMVAEDWGRAIGEVQETFVADTRIVYAGARPTTGEGFGVYRVSNGFICDTGGLYYDWDGDGIPNWWEKRFSRDGSKTGLAADADDDADGFDNYSEFVAYSDPTNAASQFTIALESSGAEKKETVINLVAERSGAAGYILSWTSARGRVYTVYTKEDFSKEWSAAKTLVGTGEKLEYRPETASAAQFFKVTVGLEE